MYKLIRRMIILRYFPQHILLITEMIKMYFPLTMANALTVPVTGTLTRLDGMRIPTLIQKAILFYNPLLIIILSFLIPTIISLPLPFPLTMRMTGLGK